MATQFDNRALKEIRQAKGYTRTKLAAAIDASHISVQLWEQGKGHPRVSSLTALVDVLECSVGDLFTKDEDSDAPR